MSEAKKWEVVALIDVYWSYWSQVEQLGGQLLEESLKQGGEMDMVNLFVRSWPRMTH